MAFAENLQYLRKKNRITQEELADSLDVSRQSVSKWETGEAYPETEKLIALCDKFDVSLNDLLRGSVSLPPNPLITCAQDKPAATKRNPCDDLTDAQEPEKSEENEIERHIYPDECGFSKHMDGFSIRMSLGVFFILLGVAACVALAGYSQVLQGKTAELTAAMGGVVVLACVTIAVFLFVFSGIAHERFKKEHPTVKNVFTKEQTEKFAKKFPIAMACLVSGILLGVVILVVFSSLLGSGILSGGDQAYCYVTAAFLLIIAFAVGGLTYFGIQKTKFDVAQYNAETEREKQPKEKLKNAVCSVVMLTATAVFLVLGFVWNLWHPGWVVFPVGGILCGIISAIIDVHK